MWETPYRYGIIYRKSLYYVSLIIRSAGNGWNLVRLVKKVLWIQVSSMDALLVFCIRGIQFRLYEKGKKKNSCRCFCEFCCCCLICCFVFFKRWFLIAFMNNCVLCFLLVKKVVTRITIMILMAEQSWNSEYEQKVGYDRNRWYSGSGTWY